MLCMLTVYFATKIFLLVMTMEMTFANTSSHINTRLTGIAGKKNSPSQNAIYLRKSHILSFLNYDTFKIMNHSIVCVRTRTTKFLLNVS